MKKVSYWSATVLFALAVGFSGFLTLTHAPQMEAAYQHLGYPLYFMNMLGLAKLLGAVALLYPRWPRLKEWAYAGFTFNMLSASVSHAFTGDPLSQVLTPLVFLGLLATSYGLWRQQSPFMEQPILQTA